MEDQPIQEQTIVYTEAQKRATKKYRTINKEKVNEQRKKYYQERKDNDPEFLEYKRNKAKEYYLRKREQKKALKEQEALSEHQPQSETEQEYTEPETVQEPEQEVVKLKRGRKPKTQPVPEPQPEPEPMLPVEECKTPKKPKQRKQKKSEII